MSIDFKSTFLTISELLRLPVKVDHIKDKIEDMDKRLDDLPQLFIPRGECDKCHEGFSGKLNLIIDLIKKNGNSPS